MREIFFESRYGCAVKNKTMEKERRIFMSFCLLIVAVCMQWSAVGYAQTGIPPKREFRGAWIQAVNGCFKGMSRDDMQNTLTRYLDAFQRYGLNTVIFQVRCEADAFYKSRYEPWSYYLTGEQGVAPNPMWDPLEWMIEQCHRRGLELHAWINPYRAKTAAPHSLAVNHPYNMWPDRFFKYRDMLLFDPGEPGNREYICRVVADIMRNYDVDGIHMDDYFYPYPAAGMEIPDNNSYAKYNNGIADRGDWRRYNVNELIHQMHDTIRAIKPWVKFGVSPFGIYHNARRGGNIPGSETNGLENYGDLYADVLYWVNKGWVDYSMPQLYWQIGHSVADYETLIRWWDKYASNRPLIIGESVENTIKYADLSNPQINQLIAKMNLERSLPNVSGSCMWYGEVFANNKGNYAEAVHQLYFKHPALQPLMPFIDGKAPGKVKKLKPVWTEDGYILFWTAPKAKSEMDQAVKYVVYRFAKGESVNIDDASHIVAVTPDNFYKLPYEDGSERYVYVVTALDRLQNESSAVKKKVKL